MTKQSRSGLNRTSYECCDRSRQGFCALRAIGNVPAELLLAQANMGAFSKQIELALFSEQGSGKTCQGSEPR